MLGLTKVPTMENDPVVVSMPFSDTGLIPIIIIQLWKSVVYVMYPMIDMAYLNLTGSMTYNIDYECITTLATSLSKSSC